MEYVMQFLFNVFFVDDTSAFMGISSAFLFSMFTVLLSILFYRRFKDKKLFKQIDNSLEYKVSEVVNTFFASLILFSLAIIKYCFFLRLDDVLLSLWVLFGVIFVNILFKIFCMFLQTKERGLVIKNLFLRIIDNFVLIFTITLCSSIIASQIPIVDITKFFGSEVQRFALINLPFLLISTFIVVSTVNIPLQYILANTDSELHTNINEILKVIVPLISTLAITICYPLSYNLFIVISIGILSKYIAEKISTYLNKRKLLGKNNSDVLEFLSPVSNILFSSMIDMAILTILIFTCLNYAGFYGITVASLGLISSVILTSNLNIFDKNSEVYKYIAKTINNIALFYIFFETLEFIYKTQMHINLFSNNVTVGLFTSTVFILFNILKITNLTKYINMQASRFYIAIRSIIYIIVFCVCFSYLLPYINYEILGAFVCGLILITALISIMLINGIDVYETKDGKHIISSMLRNSVLPLTNQITTILIVITVLLLPIIK